MRNLAENVKKKFHKRLRMKNQFAYADAGINLINWPAATVNHCPARSIQISSKLRVSNVHVGWQ